jgi:hypothetical protein
MNDFYPVVLFPKWYNELLEKRVGLEDVFPNTTMPSKPSIIDLEDYLSKKEKQKQKLKSDYSSLSKIDEQCELNLKNYTKGFDIVIYLIPILLVVCGIFILYQLGINWVIKNIFGVWLFGIGGFLLSVMLLSEYLIPIDEIKFKGYSKIRKKYDLERNRIFQELKSENEKIKLNDIEIKSATEEFHKEINSYNIAYDLWVRKNNEFSTDKTIKDTFLYNRLQLTAKSVKESILTKTTILSQKTPKIGVAEEYFYNCFNNLNEYNVYKTIKFVHFFPDLILLHKDSNIFIDIEIDEPYSYEDRLPIHYGNIDENRNNYFTDNGFFVIRFSEDQIVYNTKMCIVFIEECINSIKKSIRVSDLLKNSKSFNNIKCKSWNYEEAFNMAFENSRKNVLDDIAKR